MSTLATNKRGTFDYQVHETFEAGLALLGHEVKSARNGSISLKGAFVVIHHLGNKPELFLINAHITPYRFAQNRAKIDPLRSRKLLLHKHQIESLVGKLHSKGLTMIPIKMYTKARRIKLEIALVSGKKKYDKRETIKKREWEKRKRIQLRTKY